MNVKIENIEKNVIQLEIEVDADKFEEGMQKSFLKNASKFNVQGFRKGKAPRHIVERAYGEGVLYEDAINIICPEAYEAAVIENNIDPVDKPEVDIKQIGSGQNLIFTAKVTVKPEVELGEYKGIEVQKVEANVTDEDVETEFKAIVEKSARIVSVEDRVIQDGDIAVIDFEGFIDDVAFEGGKGDNYSLKIGSGQFIPGFEEQLIGAKAGDEVDVNVSFPENYGKEELDGKAALFKVKVNDVKVKEYPEIDDEFAQDISEFDTLAEYKEDLKKKIIEKAEKNAKHETETALLDKITESTTVDIPEVMINQQIDVLIRDFDMRLRYQGLDINRYMAAYGISQEAIIEQFRSRAEKDVLNQLVIDKIAVIEKIEATEEELDEEIKKLAGNYKQDEEEFKKHLKEDDIEYIKKDLIVVKTINFLMENAKLV
ncbi:MAG TPA: trigger factor [Pseudobacteroides sp.]|uniref:trigger factor n=1 Tax=Pseudobacteroides sp. TaxID=1968840 RepID=UPI002F930AB2